MIFHMDGSFALWIQLTSLMEHFLTYTQSCFVAAGRLSFTHCQKHCNVDIMKSYMVETAQEKSINMFSLSVSISLFPQAIIAKNWDGQLFWFINLELSRILFSIFKIFL